MKSLALGLLGAAALALTACAAAPSMPTDLDGIGTTDSRFDPTNRDLLAWDLSDAEIDEAARGHIDSWSSGIRFTLDGDDYTLAGIEPGPCVDYSRSLMDALTRDREVILERVNGNVVLMWIMAEDQTQIGQSGNALAARFGVGIADRSDHRLSGTLEDESLAISATWRSKTWECQPH